MPFVDTDANGAERTTHLLDQWEAAHKEFQRVKTNETVVTEAERDVLVRLSKLQAQLLGREESERNG